MISFRELAMKSDEVLRVELEQFRREHSALAETIKALNEQASCDQLMLRRLKRQKLQLKDSIAYIQNRLLPDIIA